MKPNLRLALPTLVLAAIFVGIFYQMRPPDRDSRAGERDGNGEQGKISGSYEENEGGVAGRWEEPGALARENSKRITAKYAEIIGRMKNLKMLPPKYQRMFKDTAWKMAKEAVEGKPPEEEKEPAPEIQSREFPVDILNAYLARHTGDDSKERVLAAFMSGHRAFLDEALEEHPDSELLGLAALLLDGSYATNRQAVSDLAESFPDSQWPAILAARNAVEDADAALAVAWIRKALATSIVPYEEEYREIWPGMLKEIDPENVHDLPGLSANLFSGRSSGEILDSLIGGATRQYEDHVGDPAWLELIGATLAVAEQKAGLDRDFSYVGELLTVRYQLSMLKMLGEENARPFLTMPYSDFASELTNRRRELEAILEENKAFESRLSIEERRRLMRTSSIYGDKRAYNR